MTYSPTGILVCHAVACELVRRWLASVAAGARCERPVATCPAAALCMPRYPSCTHCLGPASPRTVAACGGLFRPRSLPGAAQAAGLHCDCARSQCALPHISGSRRATCTLTSRLRAHLRPNSAQRTNLRKQPLQAQRLCTCGRAVLHEGYTVGEVCACAQAADVLCSLRSLHTQCSALARSPPLLAGLNYSGTAKFDLAGRNMQRGCSVYMSTCPSAPEPPQVRAT